MPVNNPTCNANFAITTSTSPLELIPNPTINPSLKVPLLSKTPRILPPNVPSNPTARNIKTKLKSATKENKSVLNPASTKNIGTRKPYDIK